MDERLLPPVTEEGKRTLRRRPPRPKAAPWLVFPVGKGGKDQNFINLCDPHNKVYNKSIPELSKTCYWQSNSHQGWFIIVITYPSYHYSNWKFGDSFLWNPESLETVELPNLLKWVKGSDYHGVYGFILSSPPTNSDSMVFLILNKTKNLMFCRPGKDTKWRFQELPIEDDMVLYRQSSSSIICVEGKLHIPYYLHDKYRHLVVEKKLDPNDDDDGGSGGESLSIISFEVSINNDDSTSRLFKVVYCLRDYVESSNEIFVIMKYFSKKYELEEILNFKVFKMNFSVMEWELVHNNLGDHVLFLGERTTTSCSAIGLGLTSGCIYYTQSPRNILYKFEPERQRISVYLSCSNLTSPWFCPYWMSMPTNFKVTEGRREVHMVGNDKDEDLVIGTLVGKTNRIQTGVWAILDQSSVYLIASYLHATNYLHFRAVCKENRLAIPVVKSKTSSTDILHDDLPPWLVFSRNNDTIYDFIDPMFNNQTYLMNLSEFLLDSTIQFSKGGWLLMSRGEKSLFFFNPFTRAIIQLPDLPVVDDDHTIAGVSFSSLPTSSDCKVFVLTLVHVRTAIFVYSSIISRGDAAWYHDIVPNNTRLKMDFLPSISNPVFYKGHLYCLDCNGTLGVFCPRNYCWKPLGESRRPCNSIYQCYLVECEGKLLSVFVGYSGEWILVFRLDWEEKVWVEVESLQKNMLFISRTSCLSVIAPDISMANRIYFSRFHNEKIIYFSLDTSMYYSVGGQLSAQDFTDSEEQLYSSWIEPSWSKTTVQELNWLDKLSQHDVENVVIGNNSLC